MEHGYTYVRTPDPTYVETVGEARAWARRYAACDVLATDTETTGLSKTGARIKFFSFSDGTSRICAPVRLLPYFSPLLEDPRITKRLTNAKFDMHMYANHGVLLRGPIRDTVQMSWHFDENRMGKHGLKECSKEFLGLRMASFTDVFGKIGKKSEEVSAVSTFHDVLEDRDAERASEMLVLLRRADGHPDDLDALQKLLLSRKGDYVLSARQLAAIARLRGVTNPAEHPHAHVGELADLLGLSLPRTMRREAGSFLEEHEVRAELHEIIIRTLYLRLKIDTTPLEMLRLMVADYASLDAWATYQLDDVLAELLFAQEEAPGQTILARYETLAIPFTTTLWNMERRGFAVDVASLSQHSADMQKRIAELEREMTRMVKRIVNFNSPVQLRELFYTQDSHGRWTDPFGEEPKKWTDGGETGVKFPSTDAETLEDWAGRGNPLATTLLEHRELSKLEGTYFSGLPEWCDHRKRIHTDLKSHGTRTGRLSSGDPNLQNIPARGDWGRVIRKLFVAGLYGDCDPAWCLPEVENIPVPDLPSDTPMTLIVADYDQLEVKGAAHVSQDPTLLQILREGKDVHSITSSAVTGIPYADFIAAKKADNPTPQQEELIDIRSGNKSALFGIFYGIGATKLGMQLKKPIIPERMRNGRVRLTCPEAQKIIDGVFQVYPGLKEAIDQTHVDCAEKLYVQTVTGRYRRLPDILSDDRGISSQAERQAFNSRIQGSAADIAQAAMLRCERDEELRRLGARMLLQIHDELVFEVPDIPEYVEPAKKRIKYLMEHPFDEELSVPLTVSLHAAKTWGDAK